MLQCGQLRVLGDHSIEACESHARKIRSRAAFVLMLLKVNKQPYRVQGKNIRNRTQSDSKISPSSAKGRGKAKINKSG